jgi:uncharacterized protein YdeI (YjbR/CyaY-like superfamily)
MAKARIESGGPKVGKAFAKPADFRKWLKSNHGAKEELIVLLYKRDSGRPSITWPELVDQLLCFGWIDGKRRSAGPAAYTIRVTPRRAGSRWSDVNVRRAGELIELGWMEPAGLAAFEARREAPSDAYSYERAQSFSPEYENEFRSHPNAWEYFASQAPYYRRRGAHYVMSAKREETRRRRLEMLIDDSERGRKIGILGKPDKSSGKKS